jgi:hypothetical protein
VMGDRVTALPVHYLRQREREQRKSCQLTFGRLLTWPADQPRHAICASVIQSIPVRPHFVSPVGCGDSGHIVEQRVRQTLRNYPG